MRLGLFRSGLLAMTAAVAACHSREPAAPQASGGTEPIACAVDGAAGLSDVCSVERAETGGKTTLTVHHPGGAFRRFDVVGDGRGLAVADGAHEAQARVTQGGLDVTVGADRYVFPGGLFRARQ